MVPLCEQNCTSLPFDVVITPIADAGLVAGNSMKQWMLLNLTSAASYRIGLLSCAAPHSNEIFGRLVWVVQPFGQRWVGRGIPAFDIIRILCRATQTSDDKRTAIRAVAMGRMKVAPT